MAFSLSSWLLAVGPCVDVDMKMRGIVVLQDLDTWAVLVANGPTSAGRIAVAPEASPIDGLLDVIIIRHGTALDID